MCGKPKYVPVAYPVTCFEVKPYAVLNSIEPVATPEEWKGSVPPELWGLINSSQTFTVRQHVKFLPKACCACPPCVKQENTFSVYAGYSQNAEAEILRIDEASDDWNRCCCTPYHPLKLEARRYIPLPGDNTGSDYSHLKQEVLNDYDRFTREGNAPFFIRDIYKTQPVMFTVLRDNGQRCCKFPCKCLSTFVCCQCCQDGVHVYAGGLPKEEDNELGVNLQAPAENLIGSAIQPAFGGWYRPTLHLRDGGDDVAPFGKIEGPCCFGGWSEMCCDFNFPISWFNSPTATGDAAVVVKKKPTSLAGGTAQLFGLTDVYSIQFKDRELSAAQKVSILSSQLLADYMLFDGNTEKCRSSDEGIYCYCFYCSIIGMLIPCYIFIPTNQSG